ncbi:hypothetical protein P8605_10675 [Streptomyces sp. T-3]|nr:hypothetical protein [Streptomyces sp. T-3]
MDDGPAVNGGTIYDLQLMPIGEGSHRPPHGPGFEDPDGWTNSMPGLEDANGWTNLTADWTVQSLFSD